MKNTFYILLVAILFAACKNKTENSENTMKIDHSTAEFEDAEASNENNFTVHPIEHASIVLTWDDMVIYVDPVGGETMFTSYLEPSIILITDIHADHFDIPTLEALVDEKTSIIAPQAVFDKLSVSLKNQTEVLKNGDKITNNNIEIEAIPMYNLRPEAIKFHEKGRGNGYVLEKNGKRIYISGDTEDITEMRNLKNIDIAFVCMNLPYTMTVEKAAEAVLDFQPKTVYPYHYRGENGMSDVARFKSLVESENKEIEVKQLDWYPNKN